MAKLKHTNSILILGFGAILACMLGSIFIGLQHLETTRDAWLRDAAFREKVRAAFLMREAVRERSFRLTYATTLDDIFDRDEQRLIFNAQAIAFMTARDTLAELNLTTAESQALDTLMEQIRVARPGIENAMSAIVEQGHDKGAQELLEAGLNGQSLVINALNSFVTVVEDSSLREAAIASRKISRTQRNMMMLSGGAVALALVIGIVVLGREVRNKTRLRKHRDQLAKLSTTDALTGIANRRHFDEFFELAWHQTARSNLPLSLIIIDVDHFKLYNDEYGHAMGDDCLAAIAGAMDKVMVRTTDLAARIGGEEFACVLPDTDKDGAFTVADSIRKTIAALNIEHSKSTTASHVTVSIGAITCVPARHGDPAHLFKTADSLLYKAKEQGRNRVVAAIKGSDKKPISTNI